jgi:hypothetical protein
MVQFYFIFSYWIFAWYLLYIVGVTNISPKFAILVGMIENLVVLSLMVYYKTKLKLILLFIIVMCILKIIPLYTIWNKKIQLREIFITFGVFTFYLFFMFLNNKSIYDFIKQTRNLVVYNKNTLPGLTILQHIF